VQIGYTENGKNYPVELSSEKMFVNVPWTDTTYVSSDFNHDSLTGFVANEHINHTSVSIIAGTGLSGGGNISTSRTLSLDFSELTDMTGDISGTTEFILQNGIIESRKAASEIKLSNFNNNSGWVDGSGAVSAVNDETSLTVDISGNATTASKVNKAVTFNNGGAGAASGITFDGSAARTISYNTIGAQQAGNYLTTTTSFGGDVSGTYGAIVVTDDSHDHIISNVDGLQTALNGKQNSLISGTATLASGTSSKSVTVTGMTTSSKVFITFTSNTGGYIGEYYVTKASGSFTLDVTGQANANYNFDYMVIL